MERVIEELYTLRLDILEQDWVQGIFYSEFLEFGEFPPDYDTILENVEIQTVFHDIMRAIDAWLIEDDSEEDKSWATLSHHVEHQKLLAILAYYIDYGTKNILTKEYRNNAMLACRVYYKLLSIPGYKAYHIYHSQLFAQSLACLGFPKALCDQEDKYFNTKELTREVNSIIKELRHFVLDLRVIIHSLQLSPCDMNFEDILSNLVDITGGAIVNKLNIDKIELANISQVIYQIIDVLICDANWEPDTSAIRLLFKCILPKLVAASMDCRNANNLVRASYVTYSGLILTKYGKAALTGYTTLLEYLCYSHDGLERGEVRQARVSLVVGLMSLLPGKSYRKMIKWLLKLSTTMRVPHRQIAMEILFQLMNNEPEDEPPPEPDPQPISSEPGLATDQPNPDQTMIEQSSADQPNASQPTSDQPNNEEPIPGQDPDQSIIKQDNETLDVKTTEGADAPPNENQDQNRENPEAIIPENPEAAPQAELAPNDLPMVLDENTQDSQNTESTLVLGAVGGAADADAEAGREEEASGWLRARAHTAPLAEILRAVYARLSDVSSAVRTRAFGMLTDCLASARPAMRNAIQELSGDGAVSRLMAWAARGVCDERAVVRRAALNLVHRSLAHPHAQAPAVHDLGILVGLCRDASIIVRSGAIAALGELAVQRPCEAVFDALLNGPMHQLSDPETKVQQQVVELVQQLLIDRMHKYIEGSCEDRLPWLFLAAVTKHNMRRHLQKACMLLATNTTCISHRLVDMLSTHLGSLSDERDLHTLVLLTSVAKHVEYKELDFALDYYYKLADDPEPRDGRLSALALELLSTWARWARLAARTQLRTRLVHRLATADDDGTRLASAMLARHLANYDLTWATELMQLSERAALESGCVAEWVRAADLSLVAPAPPSPALLRLFLTAVNCPSAEWSPETHGVAVAGLGRLCIRSRETAAQAAQPLANLLQDNTAPLAARINALYTLTDVCVRYTCIVEPLLGCVCGCVRADAAPLLRRCAARALTRLLLAGYLRLRTPLYYRYCALLADGDADVREPAEYYVSCCLTADTIYHHFVDCVLHYNQDTESAIPFDSRQLIYDVMLQRLSLVQILNLQCRLARDILEHAADVTDEGDGELPTSLNAALLDTITLLCGPRMKLPKRPQRDPDAGDMDDLHERVTTNIVSHKMKCTVAEVLVPAVLRLHARLRGRGGQAVTYLVRLARDLLTDYRHEIEELIEDDEELVERVRQFQETIGSEPSFGNARNLVTASAGPDPETPRAPRKRARNSRNARSPPRKRPLRI